ncbi:MAG: hypothetical protein ACE366_31650 [Bradymonadia bacterium]
MHTGPRTLLSTSLRCLPALVVFMCATTASAQEVWDRQKGDCERVIRNAPTQSLDNIRRCTLTWEMYRDVTQVDADWRQLARRAFEKLYLRGNDRDAVTALSALKRLGLRPSKLRPSTRLVERTNNQPAMPVARTEATTPLANPDNDITPEALDALLPDRDKSTRHTQRGFSALKSKNPRGALSEFLIASDADPTDARPLYGAAQAYAMSRKPRKAINALRQMKDIESDESRRLVLRAAKDPSFRGLRAIEGFKDLTGTAVIQILNGAEEAGVPRIKEFRDKLEAAGLPVARVATDRTPRNATIMFSKPGFSRQVEQIRRTLRLGMVHKKPITWQSKYDIILVYGAPKKSKWVDDEAEKSGKDEAEKKKQAEAQAKQAAQQAEAARKAAMKEQMEQFKMYQEMMKQQPQVPEPTTDQAIDAIP